MAKDYYLVHHGILGQKWGIRRFQNEDGSYTPEGKERYGYGNKEGLIAKNKRLFSANLEKNRISRLHGKEREKAVREYRKKYGFSYQNATIFGVREANKIAKYAHKKNLSETKATNRYLLKKVGSSLATIGAIYGTSYLIMTHPEQAFQVMLKGEKIVDNVVGYLKIGIDELKVRMDPNIIDVKPRTIVDIAGYLPYEVFKNG